MEVQVANNELRCFRTITPIVLGFILSSPESLSGWITSTALAIDSDMLPASFCSPWKGIKAIPCGLRLALAYLGGSDFVK